MKKVFEVSGFKGELIAGYNFRGTLVPPNLPASHDVRQECDDRSIKVPSSSGSLWLWVEDINTASNIAVAVFGADDEVVRCDTIEVDPKHQRKGIASALYESASHLFKASVVPSSDRTDDAVAFWAGRTSIDA